MKIVRIVFVLIIFVACTDRMEHYLTITGNKSSIKQILFLKNNKMVSLSERGIIKIWNTSNGKMLKIISGFKGKNRKIKFSKKKNELIVFNNNSSIMLINLESWKKRVINLKTKIVNCFYNDDDLFYVLGESGKIYVYKRQLQKQIKYNTGLKKIKLAFYLKNKESVLLFADDDLYIYDLINKRLFDKANESKQPIKKIIISNDSGYFIGFDNLNNIFIWDLNTLKLLRTVKLHKFPIISAKFAKNKLNVYSTDKSGQIILWNIKSGVIISNYNVQGFPYLDIKKHIIAAVSSSVIVMYKF